MASNRRDLLVETAARLFYRDGYHATGIDRILAESGVAKMTLYKHFKSKDELILAALRRQDEQFRNWLMQAVEKRARAPREQLLAIFDALDEWFGSPQFNGCAFLKASAEFSGRDNPVRAVAAENKRLTLAYFRNRAEAAGASDPGRLARRLLLLADGAIAAAHVWDDRDAAREAGAAAATLIDHAIPRT